MKKGKDFDSLLEESIQNIRDDRDVAKEALGDLLAYIGKNEDRHKDTSISVAKYLEVLQRSNEQLVKLASILKKEQSASQEFTDSDRENIFESLKALPKKDKK